MCDVRWLDLRIDPNGRRPGWCYLGDPRTANTSPPGLARYSSLRSWLSQWSYDLSNAKGPKNAARGPYNTYVRDAPEGRKVRNHFLPTCGTTVFWEADLRPGLVGVAVGAFGERDFPRPMRSVWEEAKHDWVAFAHDLLHLPQGRAG